MTLHAPTASGSARERASQSHASSGSIPTSCRARWRGFVLLNTPHNLTGKVFTWAEMEILARLAIDADAIVIVDEVYERLVYDADRPHLHLA